MSTARLHPPPRFYRWTFPGAPIVIRLNLDTVRWMQAQFKVPGGNRTGASKFGLLLGEARPGVTEILNCEPLVSSAGAAVQSAIRAAKQVVGFYRIIENDTICMSQEDMDLAASLFPDPNCVFLLIESQTTGLGDARFCFWGEGQLHDLPIMVFPYDVDRLDSVERRRELQKAAEPATPDAAPEVPGPTLVAIPAEPPKSAPRRTPWFARPTAAGLTAALALVVVVSALAGAMFLSRRSSGSPAALVGKAPLGLAAQKFGGSLLLSWKADSPLIQSATSGNLLIRDGTMERTIPLGKEQLTVGKVVYAAVPDHAEFQLIVETGGRVNRESLTVVSARTPAGESGATEQRPLEFAGVLTVKVHEAPPAPPVAKSHRKLKAFKPLASRQPAPAARIDDAPPAQISPPAIAGDGALASLVAPRAGLPRPVLSVTERAVAPPAAGRPPIPTHRAVPRVSAQTAMTLSAAVTVDVKVSIDSLGDVTRADALPKAGLHPLLRDAATQAARRWKFQPATLNGRPIPAEIVLKFNFGPTDQANRR